MLIQEDLRAWKPPARGLRGAGEPLNPEVIEQVRAAWGMTIRDGYGQTETTAQIGNYAGAEGQAGFDGPPAAGLPHPAAGHGRRRREEGACASCMHRRVRCR